MVTHQALVLFLGVAELDVGGGRPEEAARDAEHGAREQREPGVAGAVVVPQAADVAGVPEGSDGEAQLRAQHVEDGAAEEGDEGEQPVEEGVGLVGHVCRGRLAAAGAEARERRVYAREAEQDAGGG